MVRQLRSGCDLLLALITICFLLFGSSAGAQTPVLWEIGRNDRSAREFSKDARSQLEYDVRTSDWKRDWAATQICGTRYGVAFELSDASSESYVLRIYVLASSTIVPQLAIDINGHKGTFFLHPEFVRSAVEPDPVRLGEVVIDVPSDQLHQGANEITFSCVHPRAEHADEKNAARIRYDYVSLSRGKSAPRASVTTTLTPTIFYRQKGNQLVEVVNATVRFGGEAPAQNAVLKANGRQFTAALQPMKGFGEQSIEFEVPEWLGSASAQLTIGSESSTFQIQAARKWKLYVVPQTHLDIGYTDYQGKVAEVQARTLQDAMTMIREHPDFRVWEATLTRYEFATTNVSCE